MNNNLKLIIVISGKRKSGKDFITKAITETLVENNCYVLKVADPIKLHFCKTYNLDFVKMSSASSYKELHRQNMIKWSDEERAKEPDVFRRVVVEQATMSCKPYWIVNDARIPADFEFFQKVALKNNVPFYSLRVEADLSTRQKRNWIFTHGVDDVDSECGLDHYRHWDFVIQNSMEDDAVITVREFCNSIVF